MRKMIYIRYNPGKRRRSRHLYQWKVGVLGRTHRVDKGDLGIGATMQNRLLAHPGKWYKKGEVAKGCD